MLDMESRHGTELVQGAIYEFHKPDPGERVQVEIVFMHGLQVKAADLKDAYYKTWRTADGKEVWPETWLKEKYRNARILSLAYDSSARQNGTAGNMTPYLLGEYLLHQMVSTKGNIGQKDCPVVFVGHSLGGLIAKEIVVCCNSDRANVKYQNLLRNIKAVFFYATPHQGSDLVNAWFSKIADPFPFIKKSSLVEYLKPEGTDRTHTHDKFLRAIRKNDCKFYVVAEGQESKLLVGLRKWIVRENSARLVGHDCLMLPNADHMTVCKPQSEKDAGYLKLINCIDKVIKEYKRRISVHLSVDPIGIEGKTDDISKLLERPKVSIVGLFGMGGAGKTTLSKKFYNRKAFKYAKSCYLEKVTSKDVQDVQKELLRGLCGVRLDQDEQVEQKHLDLIKACFLTQKVLVVIDDVSSEDWLRDFQVVHALKSGSQSKVVVTGRNNRILPQKYVDSGNAHRVRVDGIKDPKDSDLELFLRYALDAVPKGDKKKVRNELLDKAKRIVQLCNGLPLSLELQGRFLGNSRLVGKCKDLEKWKEMWDDAYRGLHQAQIVDGDKLWSSLRISYDRLGNREKEMFLDFACIFSEMKVGKSFVEQIWDSPTGVQNLLDNSLLKAQGGCFVMHDQLRDMGRHILLEEALKDHQGPIYFWKTNDCLSKAYAEFKKCTTKSSVPYIASGENEVGKNLSKYSKLRLLLVDKCDTPSLVDDCLSRCSRDLKWLRLKNCSGDLKIGMQKLCSFGGLRVLHIFKCDKIMELPKDIGKLVNLVEIEVMDCHNLSSLPNTIGKLKNLKRLIITRCQGLLVVPESIGELSKVEHLSFENCNNLKEICDKQICTQELVTLKLPIVPKTCLHPCPKLQHLNIKNGQGVKEFPRDFFKIDMPKLKVFKWKNDHSIEVVLKNRNGSKLVLKNGGRYSIDRHKGSISQL